jgi:TPR repeat protein
MRVLTVVFFSLLIAQMSLAETDLSPLVKKAENGDVQAQSKLAAAYFHGWDGQNQNRGEAYFWFSICAYHASVYLALPKEELDKSMRQAILQRDEQKIASLMASSLQGRMLQECTRGAELSRQEANSGTHMPGRPFTTVAAADARIAAWKSQHPLALPKPKSSQEIDSEKLGYRLSQEATASSYDMQGINALIKARAKPAPDLLIKVAGMGRAEIVQRLIAAGMDVNYTNLNGGTAVAAAARSGNLETLNILIQSGAKLDQQDTLHQTPLLWAVEAGKADVVRALAKAGANIEARDSTHRTPLMIAAEKGNNEVVSALLESGANPNAGDGDSNENIGMRDIYGANMRTAIDFANRGKHTDTAALIAKGGRQSNLIMSEQVRPKECPEKAKTCPDGTTIYSNGPNCVFSSCPAEKAPLLEVIADESPSMAISRKAMNLLVNGTDEQKDKVIALVKQNPGIYDPRALNSLSKVLMHKFQDDEAVFWYLAAEMRARYDRLICPGPAGSFTSRMSVSPIPGLEAYKQQHPDKIKALVPRLLSWDESTPSEYDHQWAQKALPSLLVSTNSNVRNLPPARLTCLSKDRAQALKEDSRLVFAQELDPHKDKPPLKNKMFTLISSLTSPQKEKPEMDKLRPQAEAGDKEAQFLLSQCYQFKYLCKLPAEDVKRRDEDMKRQQTEQSGKLSKTFRPLDVTVGYDEQAMSWLQKSAEQGFEPAIMFLASKYFTGTGVTKDREMARQMLLDVAKHEGYEASAYALLGKHCDQKLEAFAWLRLAESYSPEEARSLRLNLEAGMTDSELAQGRKLAEEYHAKYYNAPLSK